MMNFDLNAAPPTAHQVVDERQWLDGRRRQCLMTTFTLLLVLAAGTWFFKDVPMSTHAAWPVVGFEIAMALALVGVLNVLQLCSIELDALEPATESQNDLVDAALGYPVVALYVAEVRAQRRYLTRAEAAAIAGYVLRERRRDEEARLDLARRRNIERLVRDSAEHVAKRKD